MVNNPDSITVNGKKEDFSVSEDKDAGYNCMYQSLFALNYLLDLRQI